MQLLVELSITNGHDFITKAGIDHSIVLSPRPVHYVRPRLASSSAML